jgi:hypothetical protein
VLLELAPELEALPPLPALLPLLLLLELLPHAPSPSASTLTVASVPDHALTFIRSSAFAPVAAARAVARTHRRGQVTDVDI